MTRCAPVELLNSEHERSIFDCGSAAQTDWLRRYALLAHQAGTARVYVIRPHGERRIAGYYALSAGAVQPGQAPPRLASGVGHHPIPVIILTRLGVDLRDQAGGLGTELVYDAFIQTAAVADRVGARALLIHAETAETARFYARIDTAFTASPFDPLHLVLLMKDLPTAIRKASVSLGALSPGRGQMSDG